MILDYKNFKLKIEEGVYQPSDDSYLLSENLRVRDGDLVLEIGTGSGLISLIAAKIAKKVVATDISPIAVELARYNVGINGLNEKVEIRQGNLFDPIQEGEKFDMILFNPPYLPESRKINKENPVWIEKAWNGGESGREIIDPFIQNCKNYLFQSGGVQMVQSSLSDISKTLTLFINLGFRVEIGTEKSLFFEKLVLVDAWL